MNTSRILTALVLALSSNIVFSMVTIQNGVDNDDGPYICYRKAAGQGNYLLYFNFEDKGLFRTCMEVVDVSNPIPTLQVLEEGFGKGGEFWNAAREYESQNQREESEGKESAKCDKRIAIAGKEFTIEWFYDVHGKSQARDYYEALSRIQQNKLQNLFDALANTGKILGENRFRNEGSAVFAFKPMPDRFLCFFHDGAKVVVTNAFEKKTDKLDPSEKDLAMKARLDYLARCKAGIYYKK